MRIEINITNGKEYCLDIGNTRFGEYNELKELLAELDVILQIYFKRKSKNK